MVAVQAVPKDTMDEEDDDFVDAEEKGFLASEARDTHLSPSLPSSTRLSTKFWISAAVNTMATAAIVRPYNQPRI